MLSCYYPSEMNILLMIGLVDEPETKSSLQYEKQPENIKHCLRPGGKPMGYTF